MKHVAPKAGVQWRVQNLLWVSAMKLLLLLCLGCATIPPTPLPVPEAWRSDTLRFEGRSWHVRESRTPVGAGPNLWSSEGARVEGGRLHLRASEAQGAWHSVEVASPVLDWPLQLSVHLGALPNIDENTVVGVFLYEDDRREVDVEFAQWGESDSLPAQFAVSFQNAAEVRRFPWPEGPVTVRFAWDSDALVVTLESEQSTRTWRVPTEHTGPTPSLRLHINVWRLPASGHLHDPTTLVVDGVDW